MKKKILTATIFMFLPLCFSQLLAQVTIGENKAPNSAAVLDLRSNDTLGLLLPRVALTDTVPPATNPLPLPPVKGMFVYNTNTSLDGQVVEGVYYGDGRRWWQTNAGASGQLPDQWFYMPSFNLPLSDGTAKTTGLQFDLYQEYVDQFSGGSTSNTTPADPSVAFFAADGDGTSAAPTSVTKTYDREQLIFYVTAYSHDVIKVNNINNGVLNYDVVAAVVPDGSFINIIFKVKQ